MVTHDPHASARATHRVSGQGPALDHETGMKFFYLVWCNLKRKLRDLTLLSILVAFVLFAVLCALQTRPCRRRTMADANRLIVRHRVSFIQPLPQAHQARIARIPGFPRFHTNRGLVAFIKIRRTSSAPFRSIRNCFWR